MTRLAIYMARQIRLDGLPDYAFEKDLIVREVRSVVDRILELGDGDVATAAVRGFESGILDIPWSPNRYVKSRIMPARDVDGALRILDPGLMPFPKDVLEIHRERLARRAEREGCPLDHQLAVSSVYEMSEPLGQLMPFALH
jgi:methylaspartate mutase epsilon subunit